MLLYCQGFEGRKKKKKEDGRGTRRKEGRWERGREKEKDYNFFFILNQGRKGGMV